MSGSSQPNQASGIFSRLYDSQSPGVALSSSAPYTVNYSLVNVSVDFDEDVNGFDESDIYFEENGHLPLQIDPKEAWAKRHPEKFPVDVNHATKLELLRVPGFGPITVKRILQQRKAGKIRQIEDIRKAGARLAKAQNYLAF